MPAPDFKAPTEKIVIFRDEREWTQFDNPKDLAAGLAVEATELQELFLWETPGEITAIVSKMWKHIPEKLANIDLIQAIEAKFAKNAAH